MVRLGYQSKLAGFGGFWACAEIMLLPLPGCLPHQFIDTLDSPAPQLGHSVLAFTGYEWVGRDVLDLIPQAYLGEVQTDSVVLSG